MRQTLLRLAPDTFTILLVATVVLASSPRRRPRSRTPVKIATDVAIAFMFFLMARASRPRSVIAGVAHWRLHALVLASTFVLFPIVGLVLFHCLPQWLVPDRARFGHAHLCLLPSTISPRSPTSIAGGGVSRQCARRIPA
jgi:sodium/bile acid cotransporter 7